MTERQWTVLALPRAAVLARLPVVREPNSLIATLLVLMLSLVGCRQPVSGSGAVDSPTVAATTTPAVVVSAAARSSRVDLPVIPPALQEQGQRLTFQHLTPDDGLSQSVVLDVLQDDAGFIWLATQDGLNRFDGHDFKVLKHDPADPNSLSNNLILSMDKDQEGILWIGTNGGGLNRYDPVTGEFTHYRHDPNDPESLSENSISYVMVDQQGGVWAGTNNAGLNFLDPKSGRITRYQHDFTNPSSLSNNTITSIAEDLGGDLWVATFGGGLNRLDRATTDAWSRGPFTRYQADPDDADSLSSDSLQSVYVDQQGVLWVGTIDAGLDRYQPDTDTFVHYPAEPDAPHRLAHPWVYAMLEDQRGTFWVATAGGGLHTLDRQTGDARSPGAFTRYQHDETDASTLANDTVWTIFEDSSGLIWLGTFGSGIDRFDPNRNKFLLLQADPEGRQGLVDDQVWGIYESADGTLWVGTAGGWLHQLNLETGRWRIARQPTQDIIFSIYQDRPGQVWIGSGSGLARYDPLTGGFELVDESPTVLSMFEDSSGRFWVTTFEGLLLMDSETGAGQMYSHDPGDATSLSSDAVTVILEDADKTLWVGTLNGGLNHFDPETGLSRAFLSDPEDPQSISDNAIVSMHPAGDGTLWLGTSSGLNRFDPQTGKAVVYREADGLPNDVIYSIQEDDEGHLWLSTNRGLSRFNPRTGEFKNYDKSDGLQDNEFNQGASFRGADGLMYFGGINGMNAFHPALVQDNPFVPPIRLTGFDLFNTPVGVGPDSPLQQPIEVSQEIQLGYDQDFFEFRYAALDYASPNENQYAYIMEGLDPDWNLVGNRRFANYTNVPPGDYVFRVKGTNSDGVWNEQGVALDIVIPPPFWQTWWFRVAVVLGLVGAAAAVVAYRFRAVERQRQQLEVQVQERTHELQQTMLELEQAKEKAEAASRAKSTFLASMSHELRTPLNAILGFAQLLGRDRRMQPDQHEHAEIIQRSSEHLLGLINDVLEMSKIEAGRMTLREGGFDLHQMLVGLEEMFALRAEQKDLVLTSLIDPEVPRYVRGDQGKLRQVLMNLLGNAVKFTDHGGVTLRVSTASEQALPHVRKTDQSVLLCCQVQDTGPGMGSEELNNLFEPFVQTQSGQHAQEGTGLGLSISRQYVRLMGGEISVSSERGRGSLFTVIVPLTVVSVVDLEMPPPTRRVVGLAPGQPVYRMLIVDDQPANRKLLASILAPVGFEVREAANGQEALEAWQSWQPHLIWMDMRMPVMDGYEATRRIKATTQGQATVIIALTASALEEEREVILSQGCDDYMRKPFREDQLFATAATHLGVRYVYEDLAEDQRVPEARRVDGWPVTVGKQLSDELVSTGDGHQAAQRADSHQDLITGLAAVQPAVLADLERVTVLGDLEGIAQWAAVQSRQDPALADAILGLAKQFDHDRILSLIRQASQP